MNSSQKDFDALKESWKKLVDTLYKANEKPLRFLRYFIFASYDVDRLKEDEIYSWFSSNADVCGYKKDANGFVIKLLQAAESYSKFLKGQDVEGNFNRYIDNVQILSGSARQHFILLLAGRHLPKEAFLELARNVENLFFVYIITREATKEFERLFASWAKEIRKASTLDDIQDFIEKNITSTKNEFEERFNAALLNLTDRTIQQYRMRYLLGKISQYLNEAAYGSEGNNDHLSTFINNKNDVEHILPQNLTEDVLHEFFGINELTADHYQKANQLLRYLGNLTWIEKSLNVIIGNKPFSQKVSVYGKSHFILTKSIHSTENIGKNSSYDRVIRELKSFENWNEEKIWNRQKLLVMLAQKVWDMPQKDFFAEK